MNHWHQILIQIFLPIIRVVIAYGVKYKVCTEALKEAFLIATTDEIKKQNQEFTISRAAIISGLQRKDIKERLLSPKEKATQTDILARVLGMWSTHRDYLDKSGRPRALSCEGAESEFAELVRRITADLSHYTVLFELERTSSVERQGKNIALTHPAYSPEDDIAAQLDLLARDLDDLVTGVHENIAKDSEIPHLHMSTEYTNVLEKDVDQIKRWLIDQGCEFHARVRDYLAQYDKDCNQKLYPHTGGVRISVGTFSYCELPKRR
jgi:hypothetical protein